MSQDIDLLIANLDMIFQDVNEEKQNRDEIRTVFEEKAEPLRRIWVPRKMSDEIWKELIDDHFVSGGTDEEQDEDETYNSRISMSTLDLNGWYTEDVFKEAKRSSFVKGTIKEFNHKGEVRYDILKNAAHILSRLNNPKDWTNNKNGLVYGMVQSGKTDNMCALSTLAFESGYDFIIVLTSDSVDLRNQTQERFDKFFHLSRGSNQRIQPNIHSETHNSLRIDRPIAGRNHFTANEILRNSLKQYIVLQKNVNHLNRYIDLLENLVAYCDEAGPRQLKFLVIDDEADYASLDGNIGADRDPTTINGLITRLVRTLEYADYVGYTATPYGCISADVNATIGYPRDFIWVLEPLLPMKNGIAVTGSYIGGHEVFFKFPKQLFRRISEGEWPHHTRDTEGDYLGITGIPLEDERGLQRTEMRFLQRIRNGLEPLPESMVTALIDFIVNGTARWHEWWRENGEGRNIRDCIDDIPFYAAAFNPTHITQNQELYSCVVELAWEEAKESCISGDSKYVKSIEDARSVLEFFNRHLPFDETFETILNLFIEIVEERIYVFDDTREVLTDRFIYLLNYHNNEYKLNYAADAGLTKAKKASLIIGGQRLSRGLTIEGLAVAYYTRSQRTPLMDTVTQMARWFGHKAKYVPFMRVYMQDISFRLFRDITEQDENLRIQIKESIRNQNSPSEVLYTLFQTPLFQLTNRNRMQGLIESVVSSYNKDKAEYLKFEPRAEILNENIKKREDFEGQLKEHGIVSERAWNRGLLYLNVPLDLVLEWFKSFRMQLPELPTEQSPPMLCRYFEYWSQTDPDIKFNVAFMGKEKGQLTRRQRKGITGLTDDASRKQFAANEFNPLLGGGAGDYLGDDFIDQPDHSAGREVLKGERINSLLLIYELNPNYITKNPNVLSYEEGDERFLELIDGRGIIVYSLHFPKSKRPPRIRGFQPGTLELDVTD